MKNIKKRLLHSGFIAIVFLLIFVVFSVSAKPIHHLVDIYGERENQLIGYGLVVGLDGTGDKSQVKFTVLNEGVL